MTQVVFIRWLMRIGIILFWVVLFFGFLYMPLVVRRWESNSITICTWAELIKSEQIAEFQRRTGIKVNTAYYESNEELYAKLSMTKGEGYDLIIPSDYMVQKLKSENLLQKIDQSKLLFWNRLDSKLLHLYFDPHNEFSIPYVWSIYGIGIDKEYFNNKIPNASWSLLFDPSVTHAPRAMIEDARELVLLAAYYLFKNIDHLNQPQLDQIKKVLLQQKHYVIAYTDVAASYLLSSKQCALAVSESPYIFRAMAHYPHIGFIIPQESTFISLENFVIPAGSKKQDLVYQFINFLYEHNNIKSFISQTYFFPSVHDIALDSLPEIIRPFYTSSQKMIPTYEFFRDVISPRDVNAILLALKTHY